MPEPRAWAIEVCVDAAWHEAHGSAVPLPADGQVRRIALTDPRVLVGRASMARSSAPQVDLPDDLGVSRRQTELTWRPDGWFVRDLGSANGTHLRRHGHGAPVAIEREELIGDGDELFVGSFTRLVLRRVRS